MTPLDLAGARDTLIDRLTAAGIKATGDPGAIPPVVLVAAPTLPDQTIGGPTVGVMFPIVCLHPPPGDDSALSALLTVGSQVIDALAPCRLFAGPGTYGDPPVPAYTITVTGELPTC